MVLWIGPSLLDGSSQNRVWVPLTLTLEMQGWGPRCASPRSRSPGSTGGWEGTAGEVMFVVPGSPPLEEVQPRFEYGPQL